MMRVRATAAAVFTLAALGAVACAAPRGGAPPVGRPGEWVELFNGRDLSGWTVKVHRHPVGVNFAETFRAEDGMVKVRYDGYGDFDDQFAHLYYDRPYANFHLTYEYRFVGEMQPGSPGHAVRNSGVMFHSQDPRTMPVGQDWPISVEMQLLAGRDDGKPRPTGNMCSPGTEVVFRGRVDERHCIDSSSPTYPMNRWIRAELIVLGDSLVKHVIEGDTVLEYTRPHVGGGVATGYDPAMKQDGRRLTSGFIALQSEGQPVDFRRIRIRDLSGCVAGGGGGRPGSGVPAPACRF